MNVIFHDTLPMARIIITNSVLENSHASEHAVVRFDGQSQLQSYDTSDA
jgi:hypothetical protein